MQKKYNNGVFIFRRDLRLFDNTGLSYAAQNCQNLFLLFILDPRQITSANRYRSDAALQFMVNSLHELATTIADAGGRLSILKGLPAHVVQSLIEKEAINAVMCNADYTPFARQRDKELLKVCAANGCDFLAFADVLLNEPTALLKKDKQPYTIFTPYYKKALTYTVAQPSSCSSFNFSSKKISGAAPLASLKKLVEPPQATFLLHGGRNEGLKLLKATKNLTDYNKKHDFPSIATSHLSAHLKFGTLSIRETYWHLQTVLGSGNGLLRQLYWRDFFTSLAYHFPHVFGHAFRKQFDDVRWSDRKDHFVAWCKGMTGFPIVDAGMRELNSTGFMHNRARLITASFLVKDLHIDWRHGERYFAQKLLDYDPAVNNGNWQWVASTGADAQPYFRIFNPWLQQKKFDPDCVYIKKWIPELKHVDAKIIHKWYHYYTTLKISYPSPLVSHTDEAIRAKRLYKRQ